MNARKNDSEKNRLELIPVEFIEATGRALTYGARKYEDNNWRKGMDWSRVYGALQRHLQAFWKGKDIDDGADGSGLHHLDCAAAELAFLITYLQTQTGTDDRWNSSDKQKTENGLDQQRHLSPEVPALETFERFGTLRPVFEKTTPTTAQPSVIAKKVKKQKSSR